MTLIDEDTGKKRKWRIVGEPEANASKGTISVASPIARALIGKETLMVWPSDYTPGRMSSAAHGGLMTGELVIFLAAIRGVDLWLGNEARSMRRLFTCFRI